MWEVREQGQNMGWGLRAEPAGKGQTAQIRNKGRIFFFFLFSIHLKKIELEREIEEQKSEERTPEIQHASLPLFRAWLEMKPECF